MAVAISSRHAVQIPGTFRNSNKTSHAIMRDLDAGASSGICLQCLQDAKSASLPWFRKLGISDTMMEQSTATYLLIGLISLFAMRRLRSLRSPKQEQPEKRDFSKGLTESAVRLSKKLAEALPDNVILPDNDEAFRQSMNSHWAQQANETAPACTVRPRDARELSAAIKILKQEYHERRSEPGRLDSTGVFAVRSGGHSPVAGAASMKGGVVIDLSNFNEVTPSEDEKSVVIGVGARWGEVSKVLEARNLAVAGGRNSHVGVGGLTLGGGLSFFSPRYGLVCNNIISYEVVLASGEIVTASESQYPDLWRALKGGANNFGVVTRTTARCFPGTDIWSGFLYMPASNAPKVLDAFHDFVNRKMSSDLSSSYDEYAAGPLACFTYLQQLGITAVSLNLVYTKPPEKKNDWPNCWKSSGFKSMWRFWSTCKTRSLSSATEEMSALNPPGRRQILTATTFKNDIGTNNAAYAAFQDAIVEIKKANVKGLSWTLVLQPFLPDWARKGDTNPLGLDEGPDEPLVNAQFTVNWPDEAQDAIVRSITKTAMDNIEKYAKAHGTNHRYRYLNYCADWQDPFEGYGEENVKFLQNVSEKYDPESLFQKGCVGGFKLPAWDKSRVS